MKFVDGKKDGIGNTFNIKTPSLLRQHTSPAKSGNNINDLVCNIYDLECNYKEWTAEGSDTEYRVYRGGYYSFALEGIFRPASGRIGTYPTATYSNYSSRCGLYIKI